MTIASLSVGQARSFVKRCPLPFAGVQEPRAEHLIRYPLRGLLNLIVVGLASAKLRLRDIETFAFDLTGQARRQLGLGTKDHPCDTTLYNLLKRLMPEQFREVLVGQVRQALRTRRLRNDLVGRGVAAFDGKGGISDWGKVPNSWARQTVCDAAGTLTWFLYTLRVHLVSSSARPCLDQEFIDNKSWETKTFPIVLRRLVAAFPRLFEVVTGDAIYPSRENAQAVIDLEKHYVFGLKKNQKRLFAVALESLRGRRPEFEKFERYQGKDVARQLYRVDCPDDVDFPGARQFLAVVHWTFEPDGSVSSEGRLFITSLARDEAGASELAKMVRLHWGIENNGNWTLDLVFDEDRRCLCKQGNGAVVVSWLRLLAFNIVALLRATLPTHDAGQAAPWRRVGELIFMAFFRFGARNGG